MEMAGIKKKKTTRMLKEGMEINMMPNGTVGAYNTCWTIWDAPDELELLLQEIAGRKFGNSIISLGRLFVRNIGDGSIRIAKDKRDLTDEY